MWNRARPRFVSLRLRLLSLTFCSGLAACAGSIVDPLATYELNWSLVNKACVESRMVVRWGEGSNYQTSVSAFPNQTGVTFSSIVQDDRGKGLNTLPVLITATSFEGSVVFGTAERSFDVPVAGDQHTQVIVTWDGVAIQVSTYGPVPAPQTPSGEVLPVPPQPAAGSCAAPPSDAIVFSSTRDGNAEIYILDQNGARNLTNNSASDGSPALSPDGQKIYFSSNRSGNYEIYSMNRDGSGITRLTTNSVTDVGPSVGSNLIVFGREVTTGHPQIFTMKLDGTDQTNISNNSFNEGDPKLSPDGLKVVYASDRNAVFGPNQYLEVYSMNVDGTGVTRLTVNDNGIDYHPAWSPDGSKIAFTSNRAANPKTPGDPACYDQALEIWVMNANGTGLRNLSDHCRGDVWPAWSPDGTEIVFASDRGSTTNFAWDLWKIPSIGGTATRLTTTGKESTPVWR